MIGLPTYKTPEFSGLNPGSRNMENLSDRQSLLAEEMMREAEMRDFYSALMLVATVANKTGSILGGIESNDLTFSHNVVTGRTQISVDKKFIEEVKQSADLGKADKEFMVYQRLVNDPDTDAQKYGFDYLRLVELTEQ